MYIFIFDSNGTALLEAEIMDVEIILNEQIFEAMNNLFLFKVSTFFQSLFKTS